MKVGLVLGTRPEIIKMFSVIKELESKNIGHFVIHTGQHYDFSMDKIFFKELKLNPEMINLNVGSGTHGQVTSRIIADTEKLFIEKKPDIVLVQGDTNSALAGALSSVKLNISIGHIEAGLRSFDRRMPEEYNRVMIDHISDYLFAPTKIAEKNLMEEGIGRKEILYNKGKFRPKIHLTGNTVVDAIHQNIKNAQENSKILKKCNVNKKNYFLVTAHRQENVDNKNNLIGIIKGLKKISDYYNKSIILPIHPRTKNRLNEFNLLKELEKINNLKLIEPVGFLDSIAMQSNAELILTDSGGIQEESCSLKIPCVVLRNSSDRPESIEVGASILSGCDPELIFKNTKEMLSSKRNWKNPYGDGKASEKIIKVIEDI